jgi:hypothetical protein
MPSLDIDAFALAAITVCAAFINGALGYGFSSLTVPVALVFYTNRVLNPAVVVIEVLINLYVLCINLNGIPAVWTRVFPILRLDQTWHLRGYSAPHPFPGRRLASADSINMAGRLAVWDSAGRPVFSNDYFRPPFGNFVQ